MERFIHNGKIYKTIKQNGNIVQGKKIDGRKVVTVRLCEDSGLSFEVDSSRING